MKFNFGKHRYQKGGEIIPKKVILDGKEIDAWVDSKTQKLYLTNPNQNVIDTENMQDASVKQSSNYMEGRGYNEFSGDEPKQEQTYNYRGMDYKKFDDGSYYWKSNKSGNWVKAKNFNDDFVERNKLSPKYDLGGVMKNIGAGAYGVGEGLLDNVTMGLTDGLTDKGFEALNNATNKSEKEKRTSNIVRSSGNILGQVGGAIVTGGATTANAISGGLKGANNIVQSTDLDPKSKQWISLGAKAGSVIAGFTGGNPSDGTMNLLKKYQRGGFVQQNIMPQDPADLQDVTENTVEYQGASHNQGGIPLNNGAELEKDETVIKPGIVGKHPYAVSPNLILDRETAKRVGLPAKYVGRKLSEVSRMIEDEKPKNTAMSKTTTDLNKKFALNKLRQANDIISEMDRRANGVRETSDLRQEEMQAGGFMGPNLETTPAELKYSWSADENGIYPWEGQGFDDGITIKGDRFWKKPPEHIYAPNLTVPINTNVPKINYTPTELPPTNKPFNFNLPEVDKEKLGWGMKSAALAGELAMIGQKPKTIPTQYNPYRNQVKELMDLNIDNQPVINSINSQINAAQKYNTDRSFNVQRGLNNNIAATGMQKLQEAIMQGQQINNQYKGQYASLLNNLGQQEVQAKNYAEQINTQTQDNWRNNVREGLSNISGLGDAVLKKDVIQKYTNEQFKLLNERGADYGIQVNNVNDYNKLTKELGDVIVGKLANGEKLTPAEEALVKSKTNYNSLLKPKTTPQNIKLGEGVSWMDNTNLSGGTIFGN